MTFQVACAANELLDETPLAVVVADVPVVLVRYEGRIFAMKDECSHAQVILSTGEVYPIENGGCALECAAHGASFDLATGAALELPATRAVPVYPVREVNDLIEIDIENPLEK